MNSSEANPSPLRYVVLWHDGIEEPHFDLMFETAPGSTLATWRAKNWPVKVGDRIECIQDHRAAYLDYEGSISGNRGTVRRVAWGTHRIRSNGPAGLITELQNGTILELPRSVGR